MADSISTSDSSPSPSASIASNVARTTVVDTLVAAGTNIVVQVDPAIASLIDSLLASDEVRQLLAA